MRKIIISESQYERLFKTNDAAFLVSKDLKYLVYENELFDIVNKKSLGDYRKNNLLKEWDWEDTIDLGVGALSTGLDLAGGATAGATSAVAKVIDFFHSLTFISRGVSRDENLMKAIGFIGLGSILVPMMGSGIKATLTSILRPLVRETIPAIAKVLRNNKVWQKIVGPLGNAISGIKGLAPKFDMWAREYSWFGSVWKTLKSGWSKTVKWFDDLVKESQLPPRQYVNKVKSTTGKYGGSYTSKSGISIARKMTSQQMAKLNLVPPLLKSIGNKVTSIANTPGFKKFLEALREVLPAHFLQLASPLVKIQSTIKFLIKGMSYAKQTVVGGKSIKIPNDYVKFMKLFGVKWLGKSSKDAMTKASNFKMVSKMVSAYMGFAWLSVFINDMLCQMGIKDSSKGFDGNVSNVIIPEQTQRDPKATLVDWILDLAMIAIKPIMEIVVFLVPDITNLFRDCMDGAEMNKIYMMVKNTVGEHVDIPVPELIDLGSGNGSDVTSWTN
tara:strand:+ start:100 stop:1596 length:1497 start_codon:yes stop_codon:yes gene_type:complete